MSSERVRTIVGRSKTQERGIALILVMMLLLVLIGVAASLTMTARSETLASLNFRVDTESDYVAKAGIQAATNWFRSNHYQAVSNSLATTYYNVTSDGSIFNLYTSNTTPVQCINTTSDCPNHNGPTQLITYGSGSTNYPADIKNTLASPAYVFTDFANSMKDVPVDTGVSGSKGYFCVNAYLLNYQTVNCPTCKVTPAPMETWLITSKGAWNGTNCSTGALATAEEQAIIQPIFQSNYGNALYGYCSVTMTGSSGTCTDAFNSALGPYAGGNPTVASGACDSSSSNVIDSGAGVGSNGYVSLASNVVVSGNVTIGNVNYTPPSACCTGSGCGFIGSASSVKGAVVTGPAVPVPAAPTFPETASPINFPMGPPLPAPSYSSTDTLPHISAILPTYPAAPFDPATNATYLWPCMALAGCSAPGAGTKAAPYLVNTLAPIGTGTGSTVTLTGGPDIGHPVYYDIDSISYAGQGKIAVNGFVVLNVRTTLSMTGQGLVNTLTTLPEAVMINFAGTTATLGGNGGMSAIITAPLATVTMGGGGAKGYMVGAVRAASVLDQGGYPVHYDIQLNRLEGVLGQIVVSSYSRIKQ